jgi:hypothetical protein
MRLHNKFIAMQDKVYFGNGWKNNGDSVFHKFAGYWMRKISGKRTR